MSEVHNYYSANNRIKYIRVETLESVKRVRTLALVNMVL